MGLFGKLFGNKKTENQYFMLSEGEQFPFKRRKKGDGIKIETNKMGMFICLYYSTPSKKEIESIKKDTLSLHFMYIRPIMECAILINGTPSGDAPFYAPLYGEEFSELEMNPKSVYVCLVDADTNVLKAMRICGVNGNVASYLNSVFVDQCRTLKPVPKDQYERMVDMIQAQLPIKEVVTSGDCMVMINSDNICLESGKSKVTINM